MVIKQCLPHASTSCWLVTVSLVIELGAIDVKHYVFDKKTCFREDRKQEIRVIFVTLVSIEFIM